MFFTGSMPSLVTVNNNVSLISINIAPSTWLATVIVLFVLENALLLLLRPRGRAHPPSKQAAVPATARATTMMADHTHQHQHHPDGLDASLQDFEPPASPMSIRQSSALRSEPAMEELEDSDAASVGGYSPPAWRRLGNGDRSSGFWKHQQHHKHHQRPPFPGQRRFTRPISPDSDSDSDSGDGDGDLEGDLEGDPEDHAVLEQAIRTRLPLGSQSPEKQRSPSPPRMQGDATVRADALNALATAPKCIASSGPDNYFRFAVQAEVHQRTKLIEAALSFARQRYLTITKSWLSILSGLLVVFVSISIMRILVKPATPRPVGDLVKVAGIARSFEPLIYFSEPAVAHVRDLQSTSIAVWDLAESVRVSDMADADVIVENLDAISEAMKRLVLHLTRFHTHVDGDIDSILSVMDWARMHLHRLNSRPPPSSISHVYDNIHNFLTTTTILEDTTGQPTRLGRLTTALFGMSNPQREQRMVQLLFNNFLSTLEEAIQAELQNSISLFALFDDIDAHFLKLARTVAHESSTLEEFQAELLSGLWARILGPRATQLRKFEKNRALLHDVRSKTVRTKGNLVGHHGKLLTLQSSLESLRGKLASHLLRGQNSSTLTLEDQIRGIASVRDYLSDVRAQQKSKVMETLYSIDRGGRQVYYGAQPHHEIDGPGADY
ncbi:hypothetical protein E4U21_002942 [Claviceps maximensis]|nr:hypothetical protein E4U21_002942 [Claviceps maximensis]